MGVDARVGTGARYMAAKRAARKAMEVAVIWIHSMTAKMADCLAGKMALMRVSSAGG